jgi:hypothetical protein
VAVVGHQLEALGAARDDGARHPQLHQPVKGAVHRGQVRPLERQRVVKPARADGPAQAGHLAHDRAARLREPVPAPCDQLQDLLLHRRASVVRVTGGESYAHPHGAQRLAADSTCTRIVNLDLN